MWKRYNKDRNESGGSGLYQRVLILYGSPHENGHTRRLLDDYLARAGLTDARRFDCFATPPLPCDDCGHCKTAAGCSKPDLREFYAAFEASDLVVIATPVYNRGFPAPLKALLDRLQVYYNARFARGVKKPIETPRDVVMLLTCGGRDDCTAALTEQLKPALTVTNATLTATQIVCGTDGEPL